MCGYINECYIIIDSSTENACVNLNNVFQLYQSWEVLDVINTGVEHSRFGNSERSKNCSNVFKEKEFIYFDKTSLYLSFCSCNN